MFAIGNVAAVCSRAACYKSRNSCLHVLRALHELAFVVSHDTVWPFHIHDEQSSTFRSILSEAAREAVLTEENGSRTCLS